VKCGIGAHLTEVKNSILCYRVGFSQFNQLCHAPSRQHNTSGL